MKVELIEQLGITPTPGGIDKLLQLQDTQNYSESLINPTYGRMAEIEGLMEMEMERNDPYVGLQIRKRFNEGGIVNLRMGGSLSSGFDTDDWELDDYNQQIQELKEEKRSLGFSGENSQRKTQINQTLRGLRLERLKKRFRGFGSDIVETLGRVNVADTTGMAQPPSDAQLEQFAEAVDAGSDTAARDILGGDVFGKITGGISDLLQNARDLRESSAATGPGMAMPFFTGVQDEPLFEDLLPDRGATAAEVPIDETGYALPPEIQEDQWVTLDPMKLSWRQRMGVHGELSGELEEQFGNFSEEYSPQKSRNQRYNQETGEWEYRAPPDYMEKKAWINAMKSPARSGYQMAEGGIVSLAGGGGAGGGGARFPALKEFGQNILSKTPEILGNIMTGGMFTPAVWAAEKLSGIGGDKLINPFGTQSPTGPQLPGQSMSAGMSGVSALMAQPTYSAMYNVGGPGKARGAGGTYGQSQRMQTNEQKRINRRAKKYNMFGDEQSYLDQGYPPEQAKYYADTFRQTHGTGADYRAEMKDKGFGRDVEWTSDWETGTTSQGRPSNWSDIYAHYQQTGSWDEAPVAQWGGG